VDLSLDGVLVERWRIPPLGPGETFRLLNWREVLERVPLSPGSHTLTLTIDPTGLLEEQERGNNSVHLSFFWTGSAPPAPTQEERPFLPDLAPFTPPGWSAPVEVFPAEGAKVQVRAAVRNQGRSATERRTYVDLRVNGIVATRWAIPPLLPGEEALLEWDGLADTLPLSPGAHRVDLVVNATGLLPEAREDNNTFALPLIWPPAQDSPSPLRLTPYVYPGMDDALVLSSRPGDFRQRGVVRGQGVWAHWAVASHGVGRLAGPYQAVLYINAVPFAQWTRPPLAAGEVDVLLDQPLPLTTTLLPAGLHRVVLVVGFNLGREGEQVLLRLERHIPWTETPPDPPPLPAAAGLRRLFPSLLTATDRDGIQMQREVLAVASAVYAALHGSPLEREEVDVFFLDYAGWRRWVAHVCIEQASALPPPDQAAYHASCLALQEAHALTTRWRGRLRIGVMAQRPPLEVLRDLGHEVGHLRQMLVNPRWDQAPDTLNLRAMREAQGFLYEALFLRTLEELVGMDLLLYPRTPLYARWLQNALAAVDRGVENDAYARGIALLWSALLGDEALRTARAELLVQGRLSPSTLRTAFLYLVAMTPEQGEAYARRHLARWGSVRPVVEDLAQGRLVPGLRPSQEGEGAFRRAGLLLP
jgi:hypothetical protein